VLACRAVSLLRLRKLIAEPALPYEQRVLAAWEAVAAAPSASIDAGHQIQKKLQTRSLHNEKEA